MTIALTIFMLYKDASWMAESKLVKTLALGLALLFAGTMGYSRLFLGVHSLDQVSFGLSLGAWFAFSAHYIVREPLERLTLGLVEAKEVSLPDNLGKLVWISTGIFATAILIQMVNYLVSLAWFKNADEWSAM